jgi:hypothetical protein
MRQAGAWRLARNSTKVLAIEPPALFQGGILQQMTFSEKSSARDEERAFSLVRKGDASGIERGRDIIGEKPKGISITSVHFARHFGA